VNTKVTCLQVLNESDCMHASLNHAGLYLIYHPIEACWLSLKFHNINGIWNLSGLATPAPPLSCALFTSSHLKSSV
jgi:hypothetical protein